VVKIGVRTNNKFQLLGMQLPFKKIKAFAPTVITVHDSDTPIGKFKDDVIPYTNTSKMNL
jgi:hypothetical protein